MLGLGHDAFSKLLFVRTQVKSSSTSLVEIPHVSCIKSQ